MGQIAGVRRLHGFCATQCKQPPPEHRPALICAFLSRKSEILILQLVVLRIREDGTAADY